MPIEPLSTDPPILFEGMEPQGARPCPPSIKSLRSHNRAAWWRHDLERTATYRSKSAFEATPRLGIDRNSSLDGLSPPKAQRRSA